jgi:Macrocin-O-methyltransferase (TylF)
VLLAARGAVDPKVIASAARHGLEVKGYVHIADQGEPPLAPRDGRPVYQPDALLQVTDVDAIVALASRDWGLVLRRCEQYLREDILFVPGALDAIAPQPVRDLGPADWAMRSSILTYLQVSGLRGHFAEFGTFWGRAFFGSFFELHHWLNGSFYAFDSFAGLSAPDDKETAYTSGDFVEGAYGFNERSFQALADIISLPEDRIITVPGFFDETLSPTRAAALGLEAKSISVCRVDCDLLQPTLRVLEFITPLLDDGALIYFDDWRLCRADPTLGERGAVLHWLAENPTFELVEFHSLHWQHQWFIFHRNRPTSLATLPRLT